MLSSKELLSLVREGGHTAAFDADGTLWADDIGDAFLRDLEADRLVPRGSFQEYERRVEIEPEDAYGFAVTVMAGLPEAEIVQRAEAFFPAHFEKRCFPAVRELVALLRSEGVHLAIVSASNRWLIAAAGRSLGISRTAGVAVEVEDGILTDRLIRPLPSGEGKVVWARRLLGRDPALAVGNGTIDLPLLHVAGHRVVICPAEAPDTEAAREGHRHGWQVVALEHPCADEPLP